MRKSEITELLIERSKKAQELGFPQDVEEGDWYLGGGNDGDILICHNMTVDYPHVPVWCLILDFSICLAWLKKRTWELLTLYHHGEQPDEWTYYIELRHFFYGTMDYPQSPKGYVEAYAETLDEVGAKAVCRILEGEKDEPHKLS